MLYLLLSLMMSHVTSLYYLLKIIQTAHLE